MRYRRLGNTGLLVSDICLGTMTYGGVGFWEFAGKLGQEAVNAQLAHAFESGVNFLDTANAYSEGESERLIGQGLKDLGTPREDVVIATKARIRMGEGHNSLGLSRVHLLKAVEDSLQRLQTDYIDLYQIHGVDPLTPIEETMRALETMVAHGKVRYIGCSNLMAWQIMKANGIAQGHGWNRFESLQAYYSIAGRDLEREIAPLLEEEQVGLLVWSPLAGGFLTGKFTREGSGPEDARRAKFDFPPIHQERAYDCVDAMAEVAKAHGATVAQVALAYCLHKPFVTSVIIGAKRQEQLTENIAAADVQLSQEEMVKLDEVSALPAEYPGWMVNYQTKDRHEQLHGEDEEA